MKHKLLTLATYPLVAIILGGVGSGAAAIVVTRWVGVGPIVVLFLIPSAFGFGIGLSALSVKWRKENL